MLCTLQVCSGDKLKILKKLTNHRANVNGHCYMYLFEWLMK